MRPCDPGAGLFKLVKDRLVVFLGNTDPRIHDADDDLTEIILMQADGRLALLCELDRIAEKIVQHRFNGPPVAAIKPLAQPVRDPQRNTLCFRKSLIGLQNVAGNLAQIPFRLDDLQTVGIQLGQFERVVHHVQQPHR